MAKGTARIDPVIAAELAHHAYREVGVFVYEE
jgi:hypothetical protein